MEQITQIFSQLPATEIGHCTEAHIPIFEEVLEMTKARSVLEIGFNAGHSAVLWLSLSEAELLSVDKGVPWSEQASAVLTEQFPDRFTYLQCDSREILSELPDRNYDLLFIDGGHSYSMTINDLYLAFVLDIPYVLIDDVKDWRVKLALDAFISNVPLQEINTWHERNAITLYQLKERM